jgi:hypothetical protein
MRGFAGTASAADSGPADVRVVAATMTAQAAGVARLPIVVQARMVRLLVVRGGGKGEGRQSPIS